jgi:aminopeptidase N
MENWGCITFKRNVLLYDKDTLPIEAFQRNTRTTAHEVSHMWFENLVTMEWWDNLWLNEGFARYSEHYMIDKLRPEFHIWGKYLKQVYDLAIQSDKSLEHTHPVQVHVPEPERLSSIFDTISYAKGSVICRMINAYIGD